MNDIKRGMRAIILAVGVAAVLLAWLNIIPSSKSLSNLPLDSLYWWLDAATWAVILGVAIEELPFLWDIFKFLRISIQAGFSPAFTALLKHSRRIPESFGFVLLVVGLIYESDFQTLVRDAEASIRATDEKETAALELRAITAEQQIAAANAETAKANERTKKLENQALSLQKQIADAQKAAADAQIEQSKLKERVIWRLLTSAQCNRLTQFLGTSTGSIWIESVFGDPESTVFAISIGNCFEKANWTVSTSALGVANVVPLNLIISGEDKDKVSVVQTAMTTIGLPYGTRDDQIERNVINRFAVFGRGPKDVKIIVGSRPIFP